ncbi:MAG: hypothetical protein NC418_08760 [Muribaculaceae bacterium]|nr:hypothetical protein [Muribaculaceae bacterium]
MSIDTARLDRDSGRVMSQLKAGKIKSAQSRLAAYFTRNGIFGMCLPALAPLIFVVLEFPLWVACIYAAFGLVIGCLNFELGCRVRRVNYMSLPVVTALAKVVDIHRRMVRVRVAGICTGLVLIATLMAYSLDSDNRYMFIGFLVGLAIGVPVAWFKYRMGERLVRVLSEELHSMLDE